MRHLATISKAKSIAEYALNLRLHHPKTLTAQKCKEIAEEMHNMVDEIMSDSIMHESGLCVGDIVKCVNNEVQDPEYTACEQLAVGQEYKVVDKCSDTGMIKVDDGTAIISNPFYPDRFTLIKQAATNAAQ